MAWTTFLSVLDSRGMPASSGAGGCYTAFYRDRVMSAGAQGVTDAVRYNGALTNLPYIYPADAAACFPSPRFINRYIFILLFVRVLIFVAVGARKYGE